VAYLLATNESTDVRDTVQLTVFITKLAVSDETFVTVPMIETTGADILGEIWLGCY
jgi:hypothetical protein